MGIISMLLVTSCIIIPAHTQRSLASPSGSPSASALPDVTTAPTSAPSTSFPSWWRPELQSIRQFKHYRAILPQSSQAFFDLNGLSPELTSHALPLPVRYGPISEHNSVFAAPPLHSLLQACSHVNVNQYLSIPTHATDDASFGHHLAQASFLAGLVCILSL